MLMGVTRRPRPLSRFSGHHGARCNPHSAANTTLPLVPTHRVGMQPERTAPRIAVVRSRGVGSLISRGFDGNRTAYWDSARIQPAAWRNRVETQAHPAPENEPTGLCGWYGARIRIRGAVRLECIPTRCVGTRKKARAAGYTQCSLGSKSMSSFQNSSSLAFIFLIIFEHT